MAIRYRRYRASNFRFTRQASVRELELTATVALVALVAYFSARVSMATLWIIFIFIALLGLVIGIISAALFRRSWQKRARAMQVLGVIDIDRMETRLFERYVETLLRAHGHEIIQIVRTEHENTLFIIKKGSKLMGALLSRQSRAIGPDFIRQAISHRAYHGLDSIMLITTSSFTPNARRLAFARRIGLVDRQQLAHWILEFQEGR
ncbi:MAG TPA: restriction endonuclease [Candidatus Saccharimonadales bacterium]